MSVKLTECGDLGNNSYQSPLNMSQTSIYRGQVGQAKSVRDTGDKTVLTEVGPTLLQTNATSGLKPLKDNLICIKVGGRTETIGRTFV